MHDGADTRPIHVPFTGPLREARFIARPNRFLLHCELGPGAEGAESATGPGSSSPGSPGVREVRERPPDWPPGGNGVRDVVPVHLADPGRLKELLLPGQRVWVRPAASPTRRTAWSAVLVESPDGAGLVSVDTTLPNRLIHRALVAGALDELEGWSLDRAEWRHGRSRIDFLLRREERQLALEVKSVTLVEDGVALFPDAVTARGARHVLELAELAQRDDWDAAILFVLQRDDAHRIEAARSIDPDFADALAAARAAGVRVLGRRCHVTLNALTLGDPVPAN
jgi:sugar fermentation stimulation protein A